MRNRFLELFFGYIANHNTKEIHRVKTLTKNCFVAQMSKAGYCNRYRVNRLLKKGYNGCRHCFKEEDNG